MSPFEPQKSFEHLDKLSYEIGPRLAGSERSERTVDYIEDQFEDCGLDTERQEFEFVDAVTKIRVRMLVLVGIFLFSFLLPPLPNLVAVFAGLGLYFFVPRLISKGTDVNLIGTLEPDGEVERRIAVGAHYDSAYCTESKRGSLFVRVALPIVMAALIVLSILKIFVSEGVWLSSWIIFSVPYLLTSLLPFWLYGPMVSPGAEDNASGVSVLVEAARVASESDLENTEVKFVALGGEEQGLRGSKKHAPESDELDFFLNLDSLGSGEELCVIEGNGLVRRSGTTPDLNERLEEKFDVGRVWTPFSAHDHMPFLEENIPATTLSSSRPDEKSGLDEFMEMLFDLPNAISDRLPQIHTLDDSPEEIRLENVRESGLIVLDMLGVEE